MHPADRAEAEMTDGDDIAMAYESESMRGISAARFPSVPSMCSICTTQSLNRSRQLVSLQRGFFQQLIERDFHGHVRYMRAKIIDVSKLQL